MKAFGKFKKVCVWAIVLLGMGCLCGCIADTAEDSDLPWARNQGWEGMVPLPSSMTGQYD